MTQQDFQPSRRSTTGATSAGSLILGLLIGAGVMYMLDPSLGRGRRAWVSQKAGRYARRASRAMRGRAADLRNRAYGMAHEAADMVHGTR